MALFGLKKKQFLVAKITRRYLGSTSLGLQVIKLGINFGQTGLDTFKVLIKNINTLRYRYGDRTLL